MSELEFATFHAICPPKPMAKGDYWTHQGDEVLEMAIVLSGKLKLVRLDSRLHERILWIAGRGDLLGLGLLRTGAVHTSDVVAMEETVVCPISREQMLEVNQRLPQIGLAIAQVLAERIDALEKEIEAAVLPVDIRLGRALLLLAQRFGESEKRGWQLINLDLGQIDLAGIIGATRATTTHALTSLRQKGLVEGTRGRYWIRREDLLAWLEDSGG